MLDIIINVIALIVTLGILVTFHEFGHFWVARRCGVKVLRFSIGFGKAAKTWVGKDGVEYVIAPIPLGGYVRMLGQEDTSVVNPEDVPSDQREQSLACKPLWQRMAIVAAGPLANFLLAIAVFWLINLIYGSNGYAPVVNSVMPDSLAHQAGLRSGDEILAVDGHETPIWQQVNIQMLGRMGETGNLHLSVTDSSLASNGVRELYIPIQSWLGDTTEPDPLTDLGIIDIQLPAIISELVPNGRAETGGMLPGDEVMAVDGVPVSGWTHWVRIIRANPELDLRVVVKRQGREQELLLRPALATTATGPVGSIGAYVQQASLADLLPPDARREVRYNPISALLPAVQETWDKSLFVLSSVKKMIVGLISVKNINGPLTIAQVAGETASYGLQVYLGFLALLSISLGVMNLLPIPVLDGGHLLYYLIEAVTRRPVPERVQAWGLQVGLILISGIMVLALYNDVTRLL